MIYKVVLIRHGESEWNKDNKFTGWYDADLSQKGIEEAQLAGDLLKENGFTFDKSYTSVLKRAICTLHIVLNRLNQLWIPTEKSWRLNERHYGALQGLNKSETAEKYGKDQVHAWRRSFITSPPELKDSDKRHPKWDIRYSSLNTTYLPCSESLKKTVHRVIPYWEKVVLPEIKRGKRIVIVAHGNSLRSLVKHIDNISDEEIIELNIPTGKPLIYEFNKDIKSIKHYYLK